MGNISLRQQPNNTDNQKTLVVLHLETINMKQDNGEQVIKTATKHKTNKQKTSKVHSHQQ